MEEDLISKKELLERYSISYGALYRWKRKGLIPEEWPSVGSRLPRQVFIPLWWTDMSLC